jgi:hypothetical protein
MSVLERFAKTSGILDFGNWAWFAIQFCTGITGATVMAWAVSKLEWFWETFAWAGVIGVGILTWFLIGLGLSLYRSASKSKVTKHPNKGVERITGHVFMNEKVLVDGKVFVGCKFNNVTLVYNGTHGSFENCTFAGFQLSTEVPEIEAYVRVLHDFGMLKIPLFNQGHETKPSNPIPDNYLKTGRVDETGKL